MLKLIMWQKTSFAGSGLVETFLKNQKLKKKQRQLVLAGALGLIVLQCHLHMGMMLDGNGLGILDEIVLVSGGSFYPMKFHLWLSLAIKQKSKITCYGELRMRLQKAQLRFPKVEAIRPKRWPAEWFSEHQQHSAVKG